jgi:uncharacterized protein
MLSSMFAPLPLLPESLADDSSRFLVIGSLSAMIFGMGKTGFGGGVGVLSIPLMIYACGGDALMAVGLMLPLLIAADYVGVVVWWRQWKLRTLRELVPAGCVGIAAGAVVLWQLQQLGSGQEEAGSAGLKLLVGGVAMLFVVLRLGQRLTGRSWRFEPVWWQGAIAGTLWGFTSTLAHASGPIATMYLISQDMDKRRFVATTSLLYWTGNQLKVVPYLILGLINPGSLGAGLYLVPAAVAGSLLGKLLNNRVNQQWFMVVVYVLLTATGIHMIHSAAGTLLG